MVCLRHFLSTAVGRSVIVSLGGIYIALGAGLAVIQVIWSAPVGHSPIGFILMISSGLILLHGGYRLPRTDIRPEFYPTIGVWCLGGFGTMLSILILYHHQPSTSISTPSQSVPILVALGTVAGYGVGIHSARAEELQQTREQLDETVEQLTTSNKRLEQFAYAASHDLQEPLRMVSSYLLLLERRNGDDLDEEGEEYLEIAVDSATRMSGMVDGLLRYSRVASSDDEFEPVDLNAVLKDVRKDLRMKIEEHDTEITVGLLPTVEGDEDQLYQVLQNLLSNAIEYSGDEPPRVHVAAERNGVAWIITVRDEGIGIGPEDVDSIFELFQRVPNREDHTGSGIGLALCEQIVERHGGEIWVDSKPGNGSAFSFTLPAAPEDDRNA